MFSVLSAIEDTYVSGNQKEEVRPPHCIIGPSCQLGIAKLEFLVPREVNTLPKATIKFLMDLKLYLPPAFFWTLMPVDQGKVRD